jgi:GT2 family glycosyltransferase
MTLVNNVESPCVSIIIVTFNGEKLLKNCLDSLVKTTYPNFEMIIVDNGSSDNTAILVKDYIQRFKINIKLVQNQENLGFAQANNIGVKISAGEYIAFLNNDTIVDKNWLQSMVAILEAHPKIAVVQSLLLTRDGTDVDSLGGAIDIFGTASDTSRPFQMIDNAPDYRSQEIFSACAAAMLIRKKVFEIVGGYDARFFAYFEDVDLSWRIRLNGYSIVLDSSSIVYHFRGGTSKKNKTRVFDYHLYKNQLAMLFKNYSYKNLIMILPGVFFLYMLRLINGIKKNDSELSLSTLKALYWNIKEFPYLLSERKYIQTFVRQVDDDQIKRLMIKTPIQLL